jgi:hypothetical protein
LILDRRTDLKIQYGQYTYENYSVHILILDMTLSAAVGLLGSQYVIHEND